MAVEPRRERRHEHRFKCPCGATNKFTVLDGPARTFTVRCGACKQMCRIAVPAHDAADEIKKFLDTILGGVFPK